MRAFWVMGFVTAHVCVWFWIDHVRLMGCVLLDGWGWSALLSYYVLSVGVRCLWIPL